MNEKHTIRNSVIASVASGLILAVILSATFRACLLDGVNFVVSMFTALTAVLAKKVETPVWLLILLGLLALPIIMQLTRLLRKTKESPENTYNKDRIFGVVWHWVNGYHGLENIYSLCPCCQTELLYHEQRSDRQEVCHLYPAEFTQFVCEKCQHRSEKIPGDRAHAIGSVEREIRRRLRTGEWKTKTEHKEAIDG